MKQRSLFSVLAIFIGAIAFAAPAPVFETAFQKNSQGQVIDSINADLSGKINGQEIHFMATEIGGAVRFTGNPEDSIVFPEDPRTSTPNHFTMTGWFQAAELPSKDDIRSRKCIGIVCRGWNFYVILNAYGTLEGNTWQLFSLNTNANQIQPGQWYHYAYTYSALTKRYQLYLDGQLVAEKTRNWKKDQPFSSTFGNGISFGSVMKYWPCRGIIGRTRLYNQVLTSEEITESEQDLVRKQLQAIKTELAGLSQKQSLTGRIDKLLASPSIPLKEVRRCRGEYSRLKNMENLLKSSTLTNPYLAYSIVDPMAPEIFSLDSPLPETGRNGKVLLMAAQNEYEPASFIIKPLQDLPDFLPVIDDPVNKEGQILPAAAMDIRLVKVMVTCGSFNRGPGALRILRPLMLLHDDSLLKVDTEKMHNYLRLSFPEGDKYICVSQEDGSPRGYNLSTDQYPIHDARTLQAINLKTDMNQQYWITLKTEKNTPPGLYTSKIRLTSKGRTLTTIPLKIRILPFELPEPKTNYDLSRPFYVSTYFFNNMIGEGKTGTVGCGNRTIEQTRADLKNMYAHGVRLPTTIMHFHFPRVKERWDEKHSVTYPIFNISEEEQKLNHIRFNLLRETGMWTKPLIFHTGGNCGYRQFYNRKNDLQDLKKIIEGCKEICRREVGHTDILFYALDEAEGNKILRQYDVWEDMINLGVKLYVTAMPKNLPLLQGHGISVFNFCHAPDKETAAAVHRDKGLVWKYANPFPVPGTKDSPTEHRLNYGLQLYFTDHDGVCPYSFNHYGPQLAWNTFGKGTGCIYTFPTADGVVDTPAWEGHREGIDDIRYATRLRQEIRRAEAGSPELQALARDAEEYLSGLNPRSPEFNSHQVRWQIIDRTLNLLEKQGARK